MRSPLVPGPEQRFGGMEQGVPGVVPGTGCRLLVNLLLDIVERGL